jgi:hypothetical protein
VLIKKEDKRKGGQGDIKGWAKTSQNKAKEGEGIPGKCLLTNNKSCNSALLKLVRKMKREERESI